MSDSTTPSEPSSVTDHSTNAPNLAENVSPPKAVKESQLVAEKKATAGDIANQATASYTTKMTPEQISQSESMTLESGAEIEIYDQKMTPEQIELSERSTYPAGTKEYTKKMTAEELRQSEMSLMQMSVIQE